MSAVAKEDLLSGSALTRSIDAIEKTRIFVVNGLNGTAPEREWAAIKTTGVPAMGDSLGAGELAYVKVVGISARPVSDGNTGAMRVEVRYSTKNTTTPSSGGADPENPTVPVYRISSSTSSETTNYDINGNEIVVTHGNIPQKSEVTVLRPRYTLTVSRVETGINPLAIAIAIVGKTNSALWQYGQEGVWLCTGLDTESIDNKSRYNVTYSFEAKAKPDGSGEGDWNPRVVWKDPSTGNSPVNASEVVTPVIYKQFDFRKLGI